MTESGGDRQDTQTNSKQPRERRRIPWLGWAAVAAVALGIAVALALLTGVFDRLLGGP